MTEGALMAEGAIPPAIIVGAARMICRKNPSGISNRVSTSRPVLAAGMTAQAIPSGISNSTTTLPDQYGPVRGL